jgi:hypothetical protein
MSAPQVGVTRSNGFAKTVSLLAVALLAAGVTFLVVRDGNPSSSRVTVDQIRSIARVSTVEYHISEFYRGEVGRGSVEGAIYISAVVTGSVDIDEATIEIDSESEPTRATITIPRGSVHIGDPETCPDCSELVQLNRPFLRARISDEEWTALTREALVIINQKVREAGIECQTAARLETVLADFLGAFDIESEVVFEDNFDLSSCSSGV